MINDLLVRKAASRRYSLVKGTTVSWHGLNSLTQRKVGWIRGYAHLKVNMDVHRVNDNKQGWAMLELDRLDFYIDSLTDIQLNITETPRYD
jgi:hypothetical protein